MAAVPMVNQQVDNSGVANGRFGLMCLLLCGVNQH